MTNGEKALQSLSSAHLAASGWRSKLPPATAWSDPARSSPTASTFPIARGEGALVVKPPVTYTLVPSMAMPVPSSEPLPPALLAHTLAPLAAV